MEKFDLSDRYRLELHWNKLEYNRDGQCSVRGAVFKGPALNEAQQIEDNNHIMLDFYHQYIYLVRKIYVAKFSWGEVVYNPNGTVSLKDTTIAHATELNKVPKLKDTDYLIIDTEDHETDKHPFNFLYKTFVVNEDTYLYRFGK